MNADTLMVMKSDTITAAYERVAEAVCQRLSGNQRVRRNLPGDGRLRIDRQLPFLCIHRQPGGLAEDSVARELVTTEAAYLFANRGRPHDSGVGQLCSAISSTMQEHYGTFLFLRVWVDSTLDSTFELTSADAANLPSTMEVLRRSLTAVRLADGKSTVTVREPRESREDDAGGWSADGFLQSALCSGAAYQIGLAVKPVYRDRDTGEVFPLLLQSMRTQLAVAYRKTFAAFTNRSVSSPAATHYQSWGPSSMVKAARTVDRQLTDIAQSFDFLLQVTPTNSEQAWTQFREGRYRELPTLRYRPLPYHPNLLKRKLFEIEVERVEDPTLAHLFWEKQDEIDRQLTALRDLHLPEATLQDHPQQSKFLSSSLQLYGRAEASLVSLAGKILDRFPGRDREVRARRGGRRSSRSDCADAKTFLRRARSEIAGYRDLLAAFDGLVELSSSIASGVMVSHDRLLVSPDLEIPSDRIEPLLHHEVGTHMLTYFNGKCQPLSQLQGGLAGYEELQEGLAVLAEYLVGGLTRKRIRTIAARVLAVHWMIQGRSFSTVFGRLYRQHGFSRRQSFTTALRVFRGGGLTKDLIYLRGLRDLLEYLARGHDLEPLYVGKIGLQHVPYIQDLRRRGIIRASKLLPRFWDDPVVRDRLAAVRGRSVLDLMETD